MLTTLVSPHLQMPPPVQTVSFAAGAASDLTSINQLPFQSVASSYGSAATYNNSRSSLPLREPVNILLPTVNGTPLTSSIASGGWVQSGFSTLFMAQVMAQGGANDNGLVQSFLALDVPRSPTVKPDTLEAFALSKYMPSRAAAPAPEPVGISRLAPAVAEPVVVRTQPVAARSEPVVVSNASVPTMASLDMMQLGRRSGGGYAPVASQMTDRALSRDGAATSEPIRVKPSLIRPRGVGAYHATDLRNEQQLAPVKPVESATDAPQSATL